MLKTGINATKQMKLYMKETIIGTHQQIWKCLRVPCDLNK